MAGQRTSPNLLYPEWQRPYEAALLETDSKRLPKRAAAAEVAIFTRVQVLIGKTGHERERAAMDEALRALRLLKRKS